MKTGVDVGSWKERGIVRIDTVLNTPLESAFFDVPEMTEFAFQFMFRDLGGLDSNLIIGGNNRHWPLFHITTNQSGFRFACPTEGHWQDHLFSCPREDSCIDGHYFGGRMVLKLNGAVIHEATIALPPVFCWGIGSSPLMQGNADYGEARIWAVKISRSEIETTRTLRGMRNTGYDYETLSWIEPLLAKIAEPAVIRLDVDNLGEINIKYGTTDTATWDPVQGDLSVDLVYKDCQAAIGERGTAHYQRRDNDEIVIFCNAADAPALAESVRLEVQSKSHRMVPAGEMTVSCGIGTGQRNFFPLYANAGVALRRAKENGKNRCCAYDGEHYTESNPSTVAGPEANTGAA